MNDREYWYKCPDDVDDVVDLSVSLCKWAQKQKKSHSMVVIAEVLVVIGTEQLFRMLKTEDAKELIENFVNLGFKFSQDKR